MKLKAVHQIVLTAKKTVEPGKVFDLSDKAECERLMSIGAAVEPTEEDVLIDGALSKKPAAKKPAAKKPAAKKDGEGGEGGNDDMLGDE